MSTRHARHVNMPAARLRTRVVPELAACAVLSTPTGCGSSQQSSLSRPNATVSDRPSFSGVIAFRWFSDDAHHSGAIFTIGADGGGERQVSHPPSGMVDSLNGLPAVTPDGSTFIFDRNDANGNGSLWRVQADGSHEHRLPSLGGMPRDGGPTLSPDGHQIAVARGWGKLDRHEDLKAGLYIQHLDGSSPRLVAPFGYRADVGGATWPPDGRTLVFAVLNNGPGRPPAGENAGLEITLPRPTQTSKLIDLETFARGAQPKRRPDTRQTRRSIACAN